MWGLGWRNLGKQVNQGSLDNKEEDTGSHQQQRTEPRALLTRCEAQEDQEESQGIMSQTKGENAISNRHIWPMCKTYQASQMKAGHGRTCR